MTDRHLRTSQIEAYRLGDFKGNLGGAPAHVQHPHGPLPGDGDRRHFSSWKLHLYLGLILMGGRIGGGRGEEE